MRLACVTVPHFRIALERGRAPELRGREVAIGELPPGSNEIIDCSPEAAERGVRMGMPLRDARTIAPDLIILPPDPVFYDRSFEGMLAALEEAEPAVEAGDAGVAFTAIDPQANPQQQEEAARRLLNAVSRRSGVMSSIGAASSKFLAWIAATTGTAGEIILVREGGERDFLAPLSTSFLPVSFSAQRKLGLYGLTTMADVARLEIGPLQAQFGREGRRMWELVRGIDPTPFLPRQRHEQMAGSLAMPAPTVNSAALIVAAKQLTRRLLQRPEMRYRHVRQMRLRLGLLDGGSWERTLTFREPLSDEDGIVFVLRKVIEPLQLNGPVDEMTLEFIGLTGETGKQRSLLFAEQARRHAQLVAALRQLKTQFGGECQVSKIVEVEPWSRIPERRYALIDYDL
jgi:DNA polymerase-4/protein ImuB